MLRMHQKQQVFSQLLLQKDNSAYVSSVKAKYKKMREDHNSRQTEKNLLSLSEARKNKYVTDWQAIKLFEPVKPGLHVIA